MCAVHIVNENCKYFGRENVESSVVEASVQDERCLMTEQRSGVSLVVYCRQDDGWSRDMPHIR